MINRILEWLNKTGYPLELFGEAILSEYEFEIINSHLYKDNEKNIFRELDLLAERSWGTAELNLTIELIIECKKSEKPFLLLTNKEQISKNFSLVEYLKMDNPNLAVFFNSPNTKVDLVGSFSSGFKVVQAFVDGDEVIHKASNTLFKAYNHLSQQDKEYAETSIQENYHSILIPLLLIDAPFFEVCLNDKNGIAIRELHSGVLENLTTLGDMYLTFPIPIIVKTHFHEFLQNISIVGQDLFTFLSNNPEKNIKNIDTTKIVLRQ